MAGSGATVGPAVGGGRVPAPGGAVIDPGGPGLVLFVILCLTKLESFTFFNSKRYATHWKILGKTSSPPQHVAFLPSSIVIFLAPSSYKDPL